MFEKKGGVFLKKRWSFSWKKAEFFWKKGGVFFEKSRSFFEKKAECFFLNKMMVFFCFCVARKVKNFKFEGLKLEVEVVAQT